MSPPCGRYRANPRRRVADDVPPQSSERASWFSPWPAAFCTRYAKEGGDVFSIVLREYLESSALKCWSFSQEGGQKSGLFHLLARFYWSRAPVVVGNQVRLVPYEHCQDARRAPCRTGTRRTGDHCIRETRLWTWQETGTAAEVDFTNQETGSTTGDQEQDEVIGQEKSGVRADMRIWSLSSALLSKKSVSSSIGTFNLVQIHRDEFAIGYATSSSLVARDKPLRGGRNLHVVSLPRYSDMKRTAARNHY